MRFKVNFSFFLLIFFSTLSFSCGYLKEFLNQKKTERIVKKIKIKTDQSQIYVPKFLLNFISDKYIDYIKTNYAKVKLSDAEISVNIPRSPLKLKVFLKEKKMGALKNDYTLYLPEGGGVVDLAQYLTEKEGSFYVQFSFYKKKNKGQKKDFLKNFLLFYSSHTKKTSFGGFSPGTHCGTFLDLTTFGKKFLNKKGLLIQTKGKDDTQPIQYIGGIFYFVYFKGKYLYLGAIQFKDSRFPSLQC